MNRMNVAFVVIAVMLMAGCKEGRGPTEITATGGQGSNFEEKDPTEVAATGGQGPAWYAINDVCLRGVVHYVTVSPPGSVSIIRAGDIDNRAIPCTNSQK